MLAVQVVADVQPTLGVLSAVQQRQVPFATALALTHTAQAAVKTVKAQLPQRFTGRGQLGWVAKGVRIEAATKGHPESVVKDIDWFMYYQEVGGEKRALTAAEMAVPHGESAKQYRAMRPSAVAQLPGVFRNRLQNGTEFIGMRNGHGRYPFALLYILKLAVQVPPRWDFEKTVQQVATDRFATEFAAAMQAAVRTAN